MIVSFANPRMLIVSLERARRPHQPYQEAEGCGDIRKNNDTAGQSRFGEAGRCADSCASDVRCLSGLSDMWAETLAGSIFSVAGELGYDPTREQIHEAIAIIDRSANLWEHYGSVVKAD
jgi:hypothetical protein